MAVDESLSEGSERPIHETRRSRAPRTLERGEPFVPPNDERNAGDKCSQCTAMRWVTEGGAPAL